MDRTEFNFPDISRALSYPGEQKRQKRRKEELQAKGTTTALLIPEAREDIGCMISGTPGAKGQPTLGRSPILLYKCRGI